MNLPTKCVLCGRSPIRFAKIVRNRRGEVLLCDLVCDDHSRIESFGVDVTYVPIEVEVRGDGITIRELSGAGT